MEPVHQSGKECLSTFPTNHDALKCIQNLTDSIGKLARRELRLSKIKFALVDCAGTMHQAADPLSQLRTTMEYKTPIECSISRRCITLTNPLEKEEDRFINMKDDD